MNNYIAWCNEYGKNSGEGQLALKFVKSLNKKIKILKPKKNFFLSHYIYPFYGIMVLWFYFFKGKKIIYVNYLPLWNFLIFLLAPPNTIFGPITGSTQINKIKSIKSFIRYFIFPFFYRLSLFLIQIRKGKIVFATNILNKYIGKKYRNEFEFNFILKNTNFNTAIKKYKKYNDVIIYYRNHENKFFKHHYNFINKLTKNKKVVIFGDYIKIPKTSYVGKLNRVEILKYLKHSRYSLSGDDNLLSLFNLECLRNDVKIIYNYKLKFQIPKNLVKYYIPYNYEKKKFLYKSIF